MKNKKSLILHADAKRTVLSQMSEVPNIPGELVNFCKSYFFPDFNWKGWQFKACGIQMDTPKSFGKNYLFVAGICMKKKKIILLDPLFAFRRGKTGTPDAVRVVLLLHEMSHAVTSGCRHTKRFFREMLRCFKIARWLDDPKRVLSRAIYREIILMKKELKGK